MSGKPNVVEVSGLKKELTYDFVDLELSGQRIVTRVADTQQKRYKGLSGSDEIGKNEGMLFMYPVEKKHRLIMRDMEYPLDVVHVGQDGTVNSFGSMSKDGEAVEGVSKWAIELPHGWCAKNELEVGDSVYIKDPEEKEKIFKGRRYIENPSDAPEWAEVQEGPQGGFYYEPEQQEPDKPEGEPIEPEDIVPEGFTVREVGRSPRGTDEYIIDFGNGPEMIAGGTTWEQDGEEVWAFSGKDDVFTPDEFDVKGEVVVERDEWGRRIDRPAIETEAHEPQVRGSAPFEAFEDNDMPVMEDPAAGIEMRNWAMDAIENTYGEEVRKTVKSELATWSGAGYQSCRLLWLAATNLSTKTEAPDSLMNRKGGLRQKDIEEYSEEEINAMEDFIRMNQETARQNFGDTVTLYREYSRSVLENYTNTTEDGEIEVKPQVLESWSVSEGSAGVHGGEGTLNVELEFPIERVGLVGPMALGSTNAQYKELTLLHDDETYTFGEEDVTFSAPYEFDDFTEKEELATLPASWCVGQQRPDMNDLLGEQKQKGRRYIDSPDEAPEGVEVHEGPQGGLWYETDDGEDSDEDDGGVLDDIMSDFEDMMGDEDEEEEEEDPYEGQPYDSEEGRQEYLNQIREDNLQEVGYYELSDADEGSNRGTELSDDDIMGDKADEGDKQTLESVIESGSLGNELGVTTKISEISEDNPFGEPAYPHEPVDPAVDVAIDTEDYLNLQFELQHKYFGFEYDSKEEHRENFFGHVRTDDIQDYAEVLQEDPGEMDAPFLFLKNDGSVDNVQEGRHRALAAWKAGVEEIPVRVVLDESRSPNKKSTKRELQQAFEKIVKRRVYVNSPEDVPEGYEVQEGPRGGTYYETGVDETEEETEMRSPGEPPEPEDFENIDPEELEQGELVWVEDRDGVVLAEAQQEGHGWKAYPVREGDERGLSLTGLGGYDVVGRGDEEDRDAVLGFEGGVFSGMEPEDRHSRERIVYIDEDGSQEEGYIAQVGADGERARVVDDTGRIMGHITEEEFVGTWDEVMSGESGIEVDFEDLEVGDEIVFEDYQGETQVAEVSNLWEDSDRDNITVIGENGQEYAVFPDDYEGLAGGPGSVDIMSDDLTGAEVLLDHGEKGVVLNGEDNGLHVEILTGEQAGEDIYGISRESVDDVIDMEEPELDEGYIPGPDKGEEADWADENTYVHQNIKVYDKAEGEIKDAFVKESDSISAKIQVEGEGEEGEFLLVKNRRPGRFDIVGAQEFDALDENGKHDTLVKTYQYGDFRSIDDNTRSKIQTNFFGKGYDDHGSLRSAKSWDTKMRVAEAMSYVKNKVSRASCGGRRGRGRFHIKVSKDEDEDTIAHELGHGIAVAYGYDYEGENATDEYGPHNLSHDYTNYADTGGWSGFIDWDLSEDSPFYSPDEYMFTKWDDNGEAEKYAVGYDSFKDEVDKEIQQRFNEEELIIESWESAEFEEPDEDATALQVFENLDEGDLVRFNVPDWDAGRDEDNNPVETKHDFGRLKAIKEQDSSGHHEVVLERANGDEWRWPTGPDGELYSDWSSIDGVAIDVHVPDEDEDDDNTGSGGIPASETAESLTEQLAARWDGFNAKAETSEEKMENLAHAVNRAWYKQARVHEESDEQTDRQKVVMETGYSATNAHETMAQLHEVMQTPTDSNKQRANDIFDEHPYLLLAYMGVWEPSPEMMEEMQELLQALGIEL